MTVDIEKEQERRTSELLTGILGEQILDYLNDSSINEIRLNPDSKLWINRIETGKEFTGTTIDPAKAQTIISVIAGSKPGLECCNFENPGLSAELPVFGCRVEAMVPPLVKNPSFCIRKKLMKLYTLDQYVDTGILSRHHAEFVKTAVRDRKSILVAGGMMSGKTYLCNSILHEMEQYNDRIVTIEDISELQCNSADVTSIQIHEFKKISELESRIKRWSPERIIVGELRHSELALGWVRLLNTGHPGGLSTIHANSATLALSALEQLILQAAQSVPHQLIATTVNVIIHMEFIKGKRRVTQIVEVEDYRDGAYIVKDV